MDDVEVEFALKSKANPIGVAECQLQPRLPEQLKGRLAGVEIVLREAHPGDHAAPVPNSEVSPRTTCSVIV